jgi:integrase
LLLLLRLAADTGARRGELAALRLADLEGRVLTIARAASANIVGAIKTERTRQLTLGAGVVDLWQDMTRRWQVQVGREPFGPWLFSPEPTHHVRLRADTLGHWFAALCADAGMPDVTLHRLRHSVATVLVGHGDILGAQQ